MPADGLDKLLSTEDARAVLQKNLANIVKKSAAGRTLSAKELAIIEGEAGAIEQAAANAPKFVNSYEELSAIFGPHRASFPRFRRDYKDAPKPKANGKHSVDAWKKFFERHPECLVKTSSSVSGPEKSKLEAEKVREQVRKLKIENDIREGLYLPRSEVEAWLMDRVQQLRDRLTAKLKNELPPKLVGRNAGEIAAKMEREIGSLCKILQGLVASKEIISNQSQGSDQ